jgi:hypothetical protein
MAKSLRELNEMTRGGLKNYFGATVSGLLLNSSRFFINDF